MGFIEQAERDVGLFLLDALILLGCALGAGPAAAAPILQELEQDSFDEHPSSILSMPQLAEGVVKGAIDYGDAVGEARKSGYTQERLDRMIGMTGNPPGPETLLALWRRGQLTEGDVDQGLRQGYTRTDWIDRIKRLRNRPIGAIEAVQAAVQGHIPYDEAAALAAMDGFERSDFDVLYQTAGNPPGAMEALNLWVRGYITEADVDQALRESRLKDKWIPAVKQLAHRKIPLRTITMLLNNGAIDDATAHRMLQELGYSWDDADALIRGHKAPPAAKHHELNVSQVLDMFASHMLGHDAALYDLVRAGYTEDDANAVLDLAGREADRKLQREAIGRVRSAYLARHIDDNRARNDLDRLQLPATQRDELLVVWGIERETQVRVLTEAQVVAAGKKGLLTEAEVVMRLVGMGYTVDDATLLGMLGGAIEIPQ